MQVLEYLSWVDGAVVLGYLGVTALLGLAFAKQSSSTEFLLANRGMGWFPVGISVMATLFSANSFLMMPGETFRYNLLFLASVAGAVATTPLVMRWIIPIYMKSGCFTAYELLEKRFDVRVRLLAAGLFILLRTGWMAAATFSCSLAVSVISGTDLILTIWVMGIITTLYTVTGGIKAVMWNDVIQFGVFIVAILGAIYIAMSQVPGGWSGTWATYEQAGRLQVFDPRLDFSLRLGTWALLIGQFVENLSAYTTDQSLVQRYLTATSEKVCHRGFIANIVGVLVVLPGLMILGASLASFYRVNPDRLAAAPIEYFTRKPADLSKAPELAAAMAAKRQMTSEQWIEQAKGQPEIMKADLTARYAADPKLAEADLFRVDRQDEAMPLFIRREMPQGMIGLVIAALLAATMSSIAGGIHSIATSIVIDFKGRLMGRGVNPDGPEEVRFIRILTLVLGVTATAVACQVGKLGPVFEINKLLNGSFSGPLLGVFILAFFYRRAKSVPVLLAAGIGTGFTAWMTYTSKMGNLPSWLTSTGSISPMWFCVMGFLFTWTMGVVFSLLVPAPVKPLKAEPVNVEVEEEVRR